MRKTRVISIGSAFLGGEHPVLVQSMCATKTVDVTATAKLAEMLKNAGAGLVRVAVDTQKDAEALPAIRENTTARLSVDLHENYRLAELAAPYVEKIRYNPGHLHHGETKVSWQDKVKRLADTAGEHRCALRIGVNCGSLDPARKNDGLPMLASTLEHADFLDSIGFINYCVSLKSSDPAMVIHANEEFSRRRPDVPIHLGLTEAGIPPEAVLKSRAALEPLLVQGIGDTLRVSLTVPNHRKHEEVEAGFMILKNAAAGTIAVPSDLPQHGLNLISCPSCARVENDRFVELAVKIRDAVQFAADFPISIAVMGCRVNGPGETDHADIGVWCGANHVNLKRGTTPLGTYSYEDIVEKIVLEVRRRTTLPS
ncbi:MAG: flavodoxin-dependent (E)-4-hydroxy-3-methylbut-2-enyl-diphosphate synthase [Planctomycetaceae bacterium]|jgi:(E)-4-hydroxy-3-methylbut-2-enyl-diphosphate synthase|nr:flavodoxin-dependent (E)-4-hydroxy-3-methylbut-2-enyl-diphosphate synthase [Planctomycetaceae bacterium]